MKKFLLIVFLLALFLIPTSSIARTNVFLNFGLGIPAPVYLAPSPVYIAPPPYFVPQPVIVQPAPVIISPYGPHFKHRIKHHELDFDDYYEYDD
ncbi:MAG: hypothetical protein WBD99_05190 [Thermodesulfobacteriota bacterium]